MNVPTPDPGWHDDPGFLPRLQAGDRVGDYRIEGHAAEGSFADVYRARHVERDLGPVALKVFPIELASKQTPIERLRGIPHLVELFEAGTDARHRCAFLAMRFVAGRSMADLLPRARDGRAAVAERRLLARRFAEVACALAGLHRCGLVHRDVKPANVILASGSGRADPGAPAVLIDVGLVKPAGPLPPGATISATMEYAAPEQLLGLDLDGRVDLFALGVLMHDLFAGRRPDQRLRRPVIGLEPLDRLLPSFDRDLAAIVAMAAEPRRELRYATAGDLVADLEAWLAGRPTRARPRNPVRRWLGWARREPMRAVRWTLAFALVWSLGVALVVWVVGYRDRCNLERREAAAWAAADLAEVAAIRVRRKALGMAAPANEGRGAPEGEVVARLEAGAGDDALRVAARHLSRDGLSRHPGLANCLVLALQDRTGRRAAACALSSQLLHDHPEHGASDPRLTDALFSVLASDSGDDALHALAAVGGLGDPTLVPRLVGVLALRLQEHRTPRELARLTMTSMARLLAVDGSDAAAAALQIGSDCLDPLCRLLARTPGLHSHAGELQGSLDDLLWTLYLLRKAAGRAAGPSEVPWPWPPSATGLALAGAADLIPRIEQGRLLVEDRFEIGRALGIAGTDAEGIGRVAAILGPRGDMPLDVCRQCLLDAGAQARRDLAAGGGERWSTDPGSRLGDELDAQVGDQVLPCSPGPQAASRVLAEWDFLVHPPTVAGLAEGATARHCETGVDQVEPPSRYIRLLRSSGSGLVLTFREPPRHVNQAQLLIWLQKGMRRALPWGGEVGLECLLDGKPLATIQDPGSTQHREIAVPIGNLEAGNRRRLEIRLRPGSNTTLRLFRVRLQE